jgi:hypothetical protein
VEEMLRFWKISPELDWGLEAVILVLFALRRYGYRD